MSTSHAIEVTICLAMFLTRSDLEQPQENGPSWRHWLILAYDDWFQSVLVGRRTRRSEISLLPTAITRSPSRGENSPRTNLSPRLPPLSSRVLCCQSMICGGDPDKPRPGRSTGPANVSITQSPLEQSGGGVTRIATTPRLSGLSPSLLPIWNLEGWAPCSS